MARLAGSINRYLGLEVDEDGDGVGTAASGLRPVASRPVWGGWMLDGVWRQLQIDRTEDAAQGPRLDAGAERVLFMLVANCALAPEDHKPKLAAIETAGPDGRLIETLQPTSRQQAIFDACDLPAPPRFLDIDRA